MDIRQTVDEKRADIFNSEWHTKHLRRSSFIDRATLHTVALRERLRVGAYCNDGHSCCDDLWPRVEVLLDLRGHRKLSCILLPAIILESINNTSASLPAACTFHRWPAERPTAWHTYVDPRVIEHLHSSVSLVHIYPQHPGDQRLQKHHMLAVSPAVIVQLDISQQHTTDWFRCFTPADTNLGIVRHVVPVWSGEIKHSAQNLLQNSLLVFTAAVETNRRFYKSTTCRQPSRLMWFSSWRVRTHGKEESRTAVCTWWHQLPKCQPWGRICQRREETRFRLWYFPPPSSSANARHRGCHSSDSPRLSNDLWRHVSGRATHGVERPVNDGGQAEVPELQRSASILMFVHLRNNHNERN